MRRGPRIALLCCMLPAAANAQAVDRPTFVRDVAPIVFGSCTPCHQPGGDAPFSLATFDQVRSKAATIAAVASRRVMPPWKPAMPAGEFHGERRLSDRQIDILKRWADTGAPYGDGAAAVVPPAAPPPWRLGNPDLVVRLPAFDLPAGGADVFRNFVVPVPIAGARWVRALQFRPGNTAVHHANIRVDRTPASRRSDEADPAPGYAGVILRSADFPDGHFLGWTPGQSPARFDDNAAWLLDAGADLVVQLHLRPTGAAESIAPVIGLYFGQPPAGDRRPVMVRLGRQDFIVPAGARAHTVRDSFVLPVDTRPIAVQAHAHYLANRVAAWADLPDGSRRDLLHIADWDPAWQERYSYASEFWLPAGTTVRMEYVFDNSAGNARNPHAPPVPAGWGWRSEDEMGDVWLQVFTRSAREREILAAAARTMMQTADATGCETLIAREPNRVDLRNDAAAIYLALNRPADALRHFSEARRLDPGAASTWFNEGVAFEALGRTLDARSAYERAVKLDPSHSGAQNNLGTILLRQGKDADARAAFAAAIAADPRNAGAHANLALVLIGQGEPDAAMIPIETALGLEPGRAPRFVQFVWMLAAATEARYRRPDAAVTLAETIVKHTARADARALDALGIALAAAGRFAEADRAAAEALRLITDDATFASEVRARQAGYRQRRAFVLQR